jgi:hypothetical protein
MTMCLRCWWPLLLGGVFTVAPARIQAAPEPDESGLWRLRLETLRLEARRAVLARELELLEAQRPAPGTDGVNEELNKHEDLKKHLAALLTKGSPFASQQQESEKPLAEMLAEVEKESARLTESCHAAWLSNLEVQQRIAEVEAGFECPLGEEPPIFSSASLAHLALWGGLASLGVLLFARRRLKERESGRVLLHTCHALIVVAACVPLAAAAWLIVSQPTALLPWARPDPASLRARLIEEEWRRLGAMKSEREEKIAPLEQKVAAARQRLDEARARRANTDVKTLAILEGGVHEKMQQLLMKLRLQQEIKLEDSQLRDDTRIQEQSINEEEARHAERLRQRGWLRAGLCLLIVLVAALPFAVVSWPSRKRRKARWRCPCCEYSTPPRPPDPGSPNDPPRLVCPKCQYWVSPRCLHLERVCFPVLGRKGSGKTHWLIELLHQVGASNIPAAAHLERMDCAAAPGAERQAGALWRSRESPPPTLYTDSRVPDPLLFLFREPGVDEPAALVHLFDCAGDMAILPAASPARGRALRMDGFLLFLDASQAWPVQKAILDDFTTDLRKATGVRPGRVAPRPVAVCLSRLDLLVLRRDLDKQALGPACHLEKTRRRRVDLGILEERSRLIEKQLPQLFPGSDLVQQLKNDFGDGFMFFPMTPVGWEGEPLPYGPGALRERTLAPFGIVEPVLWLLSRRGYSVFDGRSPARPAQENGS